MLRQGAVILDTETTDLGGAVCEISVVDGTGAVLLDTLIDPRCEISPAAGAVHGITDADVADAPVLEEVLPALMRVTQGRPVLAYNAEYDRAVLADDATRVGCDIGSLTNRSRWGCIMLARSRHEGGRPWARLEGGHRAAGDAQAAAAVLRSIAHTRWSRPLHD